MASALMGMIISSMTITAFILSITAIERSMRNAGKYPLTKEEINLLDSAGLNTESNRNLLKSDLENIPQKF